MQSVQPEILCKTFARQLPRADGIIIYLKFSGSAPAMPANAYAELRTTEPVKIEAAVAFIF